MENSPCTMQNSPAKFRLFPERALLFDFHNNSKLEPEPRIKIKVPHTCNIHYLSKLQ